MRTERLRFGCLIVSATLAGITGVVLASNIGSGSPTAGTSYLLPAFAAVFLGATQFKNGRFNAWGTIIAVILLGTLTTGLGLAGVDQWVQQFATGVVLIAALALTGFQVRHAGAESKRAKAHLSADVTDLSTAGTTRRGRAADRRALNRQEPPDHRLNGPRGGTTQHAEPDEGRASQEVPAAGRPGRRRPGGGGLRQ